MVVMNEVVFLKLENFEVYEIWVVIYDGYILEDKCRLKCFFE